jgi:hypothetical protein
MRGKDFNTGLRGVLFESRHYERMGAAVWLYGWLVLRQTRQQGSTGWVLGGAPITYREIEQETGFNCRTLERWMQVLRREGYVETDAVPDGLIIRITKAKKFPQFPQAARKFADPTRRIAEPSPRNCGADSTYGLYSQCDPSRISSSSLVRSQEDQDTEHFHRDFHKQANTPARLQNLNPSRQVQTQPPEEPYTSPVADQLQRGRLPLDAQLLRQLLRAQREEEVRRELAVGTGPEVPRR